MACTPPLSSEDLLLLFPDNTSGLITPLSARELICSVWNKIDTPALDFQTPWTSNIDAAGYYVKNVYVYDNAGTPKLSVDTNLRLLKATDGTTTVLDFTSVANARSSILNNSFSIFTGPTTSIKTFTLYNNTSSILSTAADGATTDILVGGGVSTMPVWTAATGTGAPVRTGSPTIITPTVASFTNAQHNHQNAAGGGTLSSTAVGAAGSTTQVQYNLSGAFAGAAGLTYAASGTNVTITSQTLTDIPLLVKGAASQSGDLTSWRNSSNAVLLKITSAGNIVVTAGTYVSDGTQESADFYNRKLYASDGTTVQLNYSTANALSGANAGTPIANSILLGNIAGTSATNANYSNFFGDGAGYQATNASNSNFFGAASGYNAASANDSNFFGNSAGNIATSANDSNFFGNSTGYHATNASGSNFLGNSAGYAATNANGSNFLGNGAGSDATNASGSNFFGNGAGNTATNSDNSNFFGQSAGSSAADAYNSNFLGYYSGNGATSANDSSFLGENSGASATDAHHSNFFGNSAGFDATSSNNSNFLGQGAGSEATNSDNSNFFGQSAGSDATNANDSNFFGHSAGSSATEAHGSNFFGLYAGYSATNASNSNFLGNYAGYQAVDTSASNFMGTGAGYGADSVTSSNFFGFHSGYTSTAASYSNFLGENSGYNAPNASKSNFLGFNSGLNATAANDSNFLGYGAGSGATDAANAIFIGTNSGLSDAVVNTGTHTSIAIGRYSGTGGFSDSISIGHGVKNSQSSQLNIGNVIQIDSIYGSDTLSAAWLGYGILMLNTYGNGAGYINASDGSGSGSAGGYFCSIGGSSTNCYGGRIDSNGGSNTNCYGGDINTNGGDATTCYGGYIYTYGGTAANAHGGTIDTSGDTLVGGSITTSNGGGSINTTGTGSIGLGSSSANTRTLLVGSASSSNKTITFPNATGTVALIQSANVFTGIQTTQGLTTTTPGWYTQITGDSVSRISIGLNATDVASIAFGSGAATRDAFIERVSAANIRYGAPDAVSPVAQTISVQNVSTGTSNTAGADFTIAGSQGTGTGVGGSLLFKIAPAGSTGSTQNALKTALTIDSTGLATFGTTNDGAVNLYSSDNISYNAGTGLPKPTTGIFCIDKTNLYGSYQGPSSLEGFTNNSSGVITALDKPIYINYYSTGNIYLSVGGGKTLVHDTAGTLNGAMGTAVFGVSGASYFSGAITAASTINKVTITAPATSATLTIADGSSLITAGAFSTTLTSSATTSVTLPTSGTLTANPTSVNVSSNVTLTLNAYHWVDTSSARSLTMPSPTTAGNRLWIKDKTGSNTITLLQNAAETIEGRAGSFLLTAPLGSYQFVSDGTNWWQVN